jgi:putative hydrolase
MDRMSDPFAGGFPGGFGGMDPRIFNEVPFFRELAKLMQWSGGPVNWELAGQTARALASAGDEAAGPRPGEREQAELADAVQVAELWLDGVTDLPRISGPVRAMTQVEWTEGAATPAGLGVYVEPVAEGMAAALSQGMPGMPEELTAAAGGMLGQAMGSMGAMLYGLQAGTIAGNLAGQLLATYDLGVPTLEPRTVGTVGRTAEGFAADYDFEPVEFRHWLALQEAAHRRQFAGVDWLRDHIAGLIRTFAAEGEFNPGALLEQLGGIGFDPTDPESVQAALADPDATFTVEPTAAQRRTLTRLQAVVAFTDGWVAATVAAAARDKLTALPRIEEAVRRRRAEKGPGEQFLEQLIGLDLKPADLRQGRQFCDAVVAARGQAGLDRAWVSAAHLPDAEELADPSRWLVRMAATELEAELGHDDPPTA